MFCWEKPPHLVDPLPTCSNPRHSKHGESHCWTRPFAAIPRKPPAVDAGLCRTKDHRRSKLPQRWRQQRFFSSDYVSPLPRSINVMGDDFGGLPSLADDSDGALGGNSFVSSSEGEESDGELFTNPTGELDLPTTHRDRADGTEAAFTVTAHRLGTLHRRGQKGGFLSGVLINIGLLAFLSFFLLLMDWSSWRIVRLPLEPFYLTRPFFIASILSASAGYIYVPVLKITNMCQIVRKEGPASHLYKNGTPTMGGLFFIPIGLIVAKYVTGFSSVEVYGAALATFAFGVIGFIDDICKLIKAHSCGLTGKAKFLLQAAAAICFSFWLDSANISSPYNMKYLVPLPSPLGLIYMGKLYLVLTSFCFVSMANGVNLTDGLDGLAAGITALSLSAMSIAVLPICPDLSIFGVSLAGACVGFLCHNRYTASVFMGDSGSLALGSALAAMASCTGMFCPLFVSSGIFVLEVLSVIVQVLYFKVTKYFQGAGRRFFLMAPFHHHLELCGVAQPLIVMVAYVVSCILSMLAAYVGLISV